MKLLIMKNGTQVGEIGFSPLALTTDDELLKSIFDKCQREGLFTLGPSKLIGQPGTVADSGKYEELSKDTIGLLAFELSSNGYDVEELS